MSRFCLNLNVSITFIIMQTKEMELSAQNKYMSENDNY